jgi:hypothetical protein
MELFNRPTTENHIARLEECVAATGRIVAAGIANLSEGYQYLWSLPDGELQAVLQRMLDDGTLMTLFNGHALAANSFNAIKDAVGLQGPLAAVAPGRAFTVDNGIVHLTQPEPPAEP